MSDDNIIKFGGEQIASLKQNPTAGEELFKKRSNENHFFLETFLSFNAASEFVEDVLDGYDLDVYFVGLMEIRNINGGFQAAVSIFKRQGELFDE